MSNRHILLVEDDEDDRQMLSHVVQIMMQHDLTTAEDGLEAIRLANQTRFDLVLVDLRLPNLQGWDVVESLRGLAQYRDVPIIAVTAYDLQEARQQSMDAGCNSYVTKPIDVDGLVALVSHHLAA